MKEIVQSPGGPAAFMLVDGIKLYYIVPAERGWVITDYQ